MSETGQTQTVAHVSATAASRKQPWRCLAVRAPHALEGQRLGVYHDDAAVLYPPTDLASRALRVGRTKKDGLRRRA